MRKPINNKIPCVKENQGNQKSADPSLFAQNYEKINDGK